MKSSAASRFDIRLPKEQKELFEYAASIGGYRNLTEFVNYSVQKIAQEILDRHNTILESKKDHEIFFNALVHPRNPNAKLRKAALKYRSAVKK